ncbi:hypothetical protein [Wenjunlia tyrosinilytica]|jgi:hypothetical protein|nr:hypothetical protein [Wenjunlia tyrosinilytica]
MPRKADIPRTGTMASADATGTVMSGQAGKGPAAAPVDADAAALLDLARRAVLARPGPDGQLARAALHLLDCAAEVVALLPSGDLDAARQALASARASVVTATYAVRRIHEVSRLRG